MRSNDACSQFHLEYCSADVPHLSILLLEVIKVGIHNVYCCIWVFTLKFPFCPKSLILTDGRDEKKNTEEAF